MRRRERGAAHRIGPSGPLHPGPGGMLFTPLQEGFRRFHPTAERLHGNPWCWRFCVKSSGAFHGRWIWGPRDRGITLGRYFFGWSQFLR